MAYWSDMLDHAQSLEDLWYVPSALQSLNTIVTAALVKNSKPLLLGMIWNTKIRIISASIAEFLMSCKSYGP